jgi:hypothetical protein
MRVIFVLLVINKAQLAPNGIIYNTYQQTFNNTNLLTPGTNFGISSLFYDSATGYDGRCFIGITGHFYPGGSTSYNRSLLFNISGSSFLEV